jgi:hypothetical protein
MARREGLGMKEECAIRPVRGGAGGLAKAQAVEAHGAEGGAGEVREGLGAERRAGDLRPGSRRAWLALSTTICTHHLRVPLLCVRLPVVITRCPVVQPVANLCACSI